MIFSKHLLHIINKDNMMTVRVDYVLNGFLGSLIIAWLHLSVHGGQLHLPLEVHLHRTVPDGGVLKVFIGIPQLL